MNQSHRQKQGPQRGVKQELLRFSSEVLSCDRSVRRVANPYRAELRKECVQIASPHDVRPRLGHGGCNWASNERHIFGPDLRLTRSSGCPRFVRELGPTWNRTSKRTSY